MKPRRYLALNLFVLCFLALNEICVGKSNGIASESHVLPKVLCEYYNYSMCSESRKNGHEDGCTQQEECSGAEGKQQGCYVLWNDDNGTISVKLKGCFLHDECNNTKCIDTNNKRNNEYLYCCCKGNMCNTNFSWEPKPIPTEKEPPVVKEPEPVPSVNWLVPLCAIGILGTSMTLFLCWSYRKKKYMFNEIPTSEPHSQPLTMPTMGLLPIQLIEIKARGRFGLVWKAHLKGEEIAVKVFPMQDKQSWTQEQEIYKIPLMSHANILHFIGVEIRKAEHPTQFWLITAYHELGSLCDYLKAHTLTWPELCKIVETMARGLMHLHEEMTGKLGEPLKPAIAHRDFKSKNVLLKNDMTACIADFGLALMFEPGKSCGDTHGQVGTRRYMAPEVLEGAINFTPDAFLRIDMYACGLVIWELVSRCTAQDGVVPEYRLPFEEEVGAHPNLEDMQESVVQRKVRPTILESWRNHPGLAALCETMEECWDHDAEARLSASCVMERVLNQSKYTHHSSLSMRIENEALRNTIKENSM